MGAKRIYLKQSQGKVTTIKSVLLANGNLVIPKIMRRKPYIAAWVEVEAGTSDYKRWYPVHVKEQDPRTLSGYREQLKSVSGDDFAHTLTGVFKP